MTKFRVPPGGKITIGIEADKPDVSVKGKRPGESGYVGSDPIDEQLYVFRKKGNITFYDLGTRINEDGTYRDLDLIFGIDSNEHPDVTTYLRGKWSQEVAQLSGSQTGSLKLLHPSEFLYFDLILDLADSPGEEIEKKILIGNLSKRSYIFETTIAGQSDEPLPTSRDPGTSWKNASAGFSVGGQWRIQTGSAFFYNDIDTINQRVTRNNSPEDAEVELTINSDDVVKIYLVPRPFLLTNQDGIYYYGRLPVIPDFEVAAGPIFQRVVRAGSFIVGKTTAEFWAAIRGYLAVTPHIISLFSDPTYAPHDQIQGAAYPLLTGIIVKNEIINYVWSEDNNRYSQLAHPESTNEIFEI